ncbi:PYRUVATE DECARBOXYLASE 1-LIKE [Salix koriyanagi]|uniref:PYRUVATE DECARBOXYLASE 1-LIKE n=1 Tax=Salix koriyanagi TaxID=2511006 RepID=A0A9Q0X200_9ROSI|nr:PYRUVATE DECARBOXYLASE 1-LIKE [Salix koriyanagi]
MVWGLCIFCSLIMLSIRSNFGSCLHVEGYDFVVWGLATLKELRAGNAADGAGAGAVTFLCGWAKALSTQLLGLTARIFPSSTYHWIARFYSKTPVLPNSCNLLSAATTLLVYISICRNLPAVPHATLSRNHIPLAISPRLSKKMGFEAAVEATAVAAFLCKAVKPAILGGQNCELQMLVMPSAEGPVTEHLLHFIGA